MFCLREQHLRELKETVERVYAELEALRARNDLLAAAVGACFLCFGADPSCPECAGRGHPGSRAPEPSAYREFVLPVVRRTRARGLEPRAPLHPSRRQHDANHPKE